MHILAGQCKDLLTTCLVCSNKSSNSTHKHIVLVCLVCVADGQVEWSSGGFTLTVLTHCETRCDMFTGSNVIVLSFLLSFCIFCVSVFVQSGDIEIVNHRTKETCQLKFSPYSYFSRDVPRKVNSLCSTLCWHPAWVWRCSVGFICVMLPPAGQYQQMYCFV